MDIFKSMAVILITTVFMLFSYFWLFNIGYLSYAEERPIFTYIAQAFKSLSITLILCIGYMIKMKDVPNKKILICIYVIIIFCSTYLGFASGSRMALIFPFMALIFNHLDFL